MDNSQLRKMADDYADGLIKEAGIFEFVKNVPKYIDKAIPKIQRWAKELGKSGKDLKKFTEPIRGVLSEAGRVLGNIPGQEKQVSSSLFGAIKRHPIRAGALGLGVAGAGALGANLLNRKKSEDEILNENLEDTNQKTAEDNNEDKMTPEIDQIISDILG